MADATELFFAKLAEKSAAPELAKMSDEERAAAINAETVDMPIDVSTGAIQGYLAMRMLLSRVALFHDDAANKAAAPMVWAACYELLSLINSPHISTIHMSNPEVAASVGTMLALLVQGGIISPAHKEEILALAVESKPWSVAQGFHREVYFSDLVKSRGEFMASDMSMEALAARGEVIKQDGSIVAADGATVVGRVGEAPADEVKA